MFAVDFHGHDRLLWFGREGVRVGVLLLGPQLLQPLDFRLLGFHLEKVFIVQFIDLIGLH